MLEFLKNNLINNPIIFYVVISNSIVINLIYIIISMMLGKYTAVS